MKNGNSTGQDYHPEWNSFQIPDTCMQYNDKLWGKYGKKENGDNTLFLVYEEPETWCKSVELAMKINNQQAKIKKLLLGFCCVYHNSLELDSAPYHTHIHTYPYKGYHTFTNECSECTH